MNVKESKMGLIDFIKLFRQAFKEWLRDRADSLAASIAYYQLMSVAPFVGLILIASSAVFGPEQSKSEVEPLITQFFHPQFIEAIRFLLQYSFKLDDEKLLTVSALALISLVHGTLGFFAQIKDSIETFWNKRTEEVSMKNRFRKQLEALMMAVITFALFMAGFIVGHWLSGLKDFLFVSVAVLVEFLLLAALVSFLLMYCPPVKIRWREALPGVLVTTVLYLAGRFLLGYLLQRNGASAEEIAATLVLYLLWAYYSSLVFLYGAEFSKVYILKKRGMDVNWLRVQ